MPLVVKYALGIHVTSGRKAVVLFFADITLHMFSILYVYVIKSNK